MSVIDIALDLSYFRPMNHIINDRFPFETITHGRINCFRLYQYVETERRQAEWLKITDLIYKTNLDQIEDWHPRYETADPRLPALVVDFGDFYRLIDGRHRLKKLLHNQCTHMLCHILTKAEALREYSSV